MKKLLAAFIILLIASPLFALDIGFLKRHGGGGAAVNNYACVDGTHDSSNNAVTICEDFDGSSTCTATYTDTCRNAWTVAGGTPDYDNTDNKIEGANYSLYIDGTAADFTYVYKAVTAADAYYTLSAIKLVASTTASKRIISYNNGGVNKGAVTLNANGTITITQGTGTASTAVGCALAQGNTYWIWTGYAKSSGAGAEDGTMYVAVSSSLASKPTTGDCYAAFINGTVTDQINRIGFGQANAKDTTLKLVFDHIRVNSSNIGANAP